MSETKHTPGPWEVATSCSWRRIVGLRGELVCEPVVQRADNHPDLHFRNGGPDGPDARLIAAAPDLREALAALLERYTGLVNCGDCGFWDPETEDEVKAARAALAKASP